MLNRTLTDGLNRYQIGPKLRGLRLKKKIGLVQLGQHTGLSPALLSKVERGRLFPTLPTLLRISLVFGVGLDYFFTSKDEPAPIVVRKRDRLKFPSHPSARRPAFRFESLDYPATERPLSSYLVEFEPVEAKDATRHQHPGVELIYLISGRLGVTVGDDEYMLDAGDSMYLQGDRPHSYRRLGTRRCSAVVVTSP